jgi:hypothetical protein
VIVRRKGYSTDGAKSLFPLGGELNLSSDKYSHGLRHRVADEVAGNSFDEAVATIKKTTGGKIPKRQTEEITVAVAQDFESFCSQREADKAEATSAILVMSVDQKGVVMRKEDLRVATQKAAEKEVQRSGARLCKHFQAPNICIQEAHYEKGGYCDNSGNFYRHVSRSNPKPMDDPH